MTVTTAPGQQPVPGPCLCFSLRPTAPLPLGPALSISLLLPFSHCQADCPAPGGGSRKTSLGPALGPASIRAGGEGGGRSSRWPLLSQADRVLLTPARAPPGRPGGGSVARRERNGGGWRLREGCVPAPPPAICCPARRRRKEWDAGRGGGPGLGASPSLLTPSIWGGSPARACQWGWWEHLGRHILGLVSAASRLWSRRNRL